MFHFSHRNGKSQSNYVSGDRTAYAKSDSRLSRLRVGVATLAMATVLFMTGCATSGMGPGIQKVPTGPATQAYAQQGAGTWLDLGPGRKIFVPPMPPGFDPKNCVFRYSQSGTLEIYGDGLEKRNTLREQGTWDCRQR